MFGADAVLVSQVRRGSTGQRVGINVNDEILGINNFRVMYFGAPICQLEAGINKRHAKLAA